MSRTLSRLLAVGLALVMLVGMAAVAQASPPWTGHGKEGKHYSNMFGDISLEDYPWAFKHIEKMAAKGIIKGVGNGNFNGNADIKHQEAVIMMVRYMGLEAEAQANMNATLPIADAKEVAPWARGYVKVAIDHNLLWVPDAGQLTKLEPNAPTKRVEAVVMLVKAAGLEAEAQAKMSQQLTFRDAASIPAAYVGYVAVGVEKGLVKGYEDSTFQPFKAVKRAEMATFLGRTDENIPQQHGDDDEVDGKFVAATATTITVERHGQQATYTLASTCSIYLNDELAALTDLAAGDKVQLELDAAGKVIFVDAQRDHDVDEDDGNNNDNNNDNGQLPATLSGTVQSVSLGIGVPSTIVVRLDSNAGDKTFTIAQNCVIKIDGVVATAADLKVGDRAQIKLVAGTGDQLAEILITRTQTNTVTGTVQSMLINAGTNSVITVRPTGQSTNISYLIASNAVVKYNNAVVALTEIKVGDQVTLTLTNPTQLPVVTEIVIAPRETTVSGTVTGVNYDARTLTVTSNNVATTYAVAANAAITLFGQPFTWNQLALGDQVTLTVVDSTATKINITVHTATYTGTVKSVTVDASGNHFVATIGGVDRTVDVPATAVITQNGAPTTFSAIVPGATVTITGAFDGTKIVAAQIIIQ